MRTLLLLLVLASFAAAADPLADALLRLRGAKRADRAAAVDAVLALEPTVEAVRARLEKRRLVEPMGAGWHVLAAEDEAGVSRPFQLYVPRSLAGGEGAAPLLVHMHGGVGRPEYPQGVGAVGTGGMWVQSAERARFVVAFPMGRADCKWWTRAGAAHVRGVVRETKRLVPVDDDAIVGTGFSDGGSGSFYLAMAEPWPFAAFLPMNGHPAVAASDSGEQLYLANLQRTPLFVTMTQDDQLYPAKSALPHLRALIEANGPLTLVSYPRGGHRPVYFEEQRAAFERFISDTPRDALPRSFAWRTAAPGPIAWAEILELGASRGDAAELDDSNVMSTPGRVRLGIQADRAFAGPGVRVTLVVDESTAARMGMAVGDVILALDGAETADLAALVAGLSARKPGEAIRARVRRGEEALELAAKIPPHVSRPYYTRTQPTAHFALETEANRVTIVSRHVRRFRLLLDPLLFEAGAVTVVVNGAEVEAKATPIALRALLERYAREADTARLFTLEIVVALDPA